MVDYSQSKIYKIVSKNTNKIYIGSTTYSLDHRLRGHEDDLEKWKGGKKKYVSSFKILECKDVEIVLLEDYPCEDRRELHAREEYWIKKSPGLCVNIRSPVNYQRRF